MPTEREKFEPRFGVPPPPKARPNPSNPFDIELGADILEALEADPIALFGFDPTRLRANTVGMRGAVGTHDPLTDIISFEAARSPRARGFPAETVLLHELRHRGLEQMREMGIPLPDIVESDEEGFVRMIDALIPTPQGRESAEQIFGKFTDRNLHEWGPQIQEVMDIARALNLPNQFPPAEFAPTPQPRAEGVR
jgi:hypothetical protein